MLKYDCSDEFDLCEIFLKLTSPSHSRQTVTANCFFAPMTLASFQRAMANAMALRQNPQGGR